MTKEEELKKEIEDFEETNYIDWQLGISGTKEDKVKNFLINLGRQDMKREDKEKYGRILIKIASKFGVRETLLALGEFKDVDIEDIKQKLKEKNEK